jgi:hypothetical protein
MTQNGTTAKELTNFRDSEEGMEYFLGFFEIIIPYNKADGPLPIVSLPMAHEYKWSMLRMAWGNSLIRDALCNNPEHANRFVKAILSNLLANDNELNKPVLDGKADFPEPAFEKFLGKGCTELVPIFNNVPSKSYLEESLYSYSSLMNLAKLFHSPDPKEREWLQVLFEDRIAAFFRRINEPVIVGALKTILGIVQAAMLDVRTCTTGVSLRPIPSMLYITEM